MQRNPQLDAVNAVAVVAAAALVVVEEQLRHAGLIEAEIAAADIDQEALEREADEDLRAATEDHVLLTRTVAAIEAGEPVTDEECGAVISAYLARDEGRTERLARRRAALDTIRAIEAKYASGA
ncbi:hypothetical protein [Kitasatospora sp. NPDC088548]|uniref:hypothetical protein n=1 Tax=Kitasatospora sp. NPDC088548 TaxID=3364075 RepID=UPI00382489A9